MKIGVKGTKFARDMSNRALLCTDKSEVTRYEAEMAKHKQNEARDAEINNIKADLAELKILLQAALQKLDRG
jgi:hypothetical protein